MLDHPAAADAPAVPGRGRTADRLSGEIALGVAVEMANK